MGCGASIDKGHIKEDVIDAAKKARAKVDVAVWEKAGIVESDEFKALQLALVTTRCWRTCGSGCQASVVVPRRWAGC